MLSTVSALALLCLPSSAPPPAPPSPYAGRWGLTLVEGPQQATLWVVEADWRARKLRLVSTYPGFRGTRLSNFSVARDGLRFVLTRRDRVYDIHITPAKK